MPFKSAEYTGVFTPDDLKALQDTYSRCCDLLGQCPTGPEDKDRLARFVIRAFEQSGGQVEMAAIRAASSAANSNY